MRRLRICFGDDEVDVTDRMRRIIGLLLDERYEVMKMHAGCLEIHVHDGDVKLERHVTVRRTDAEIARRIEDSLRH